MCIIWHICSTKFSKLSCTSCIVLAVPNTASQKSWFYKLLTSWDGIHLISQQLHRTSCPSLEQQVCSECWLTLQLLIVPRLWAKPSAQSTYTEKGNTGESWRVPRLARVTEWVSGVKTLLVGASTSFLLSFGEFALVVLLGVLAGCSHLVCKIGPVGTEEKLLRQVLSDSRGDTDLSPSLPWVSCSFCRAKGKKGEGKLFQRAGQTPCVW